MSMKIKEFVLRLGQAHWVFALLATTFGLIFIFLVPPLWGLDEPAHFERVYQIAHGQIFPSRSVANYGGKAPKNLVELGDYAVNDLIDNTVGDITSRKDVRDINGYKQFTDAKFSKEEKATPGSASYPPTAYIGPVLGVILADIFNASIGHTLFLARLFSLLSYILLSWLAIRLLRSSKLKWLFVVVPLLPTALFQGSVVSADGMLIGLSLLFMALFIRLMRASQDNNKNLLYSLIVVAIILPLIKFNYIFLSFALIFVPNGIFNNKKITVALKATGVLLATIFSVAWAAVTNAISNAPFSLRQDGLPVNAANQISIVLHDPLHLITACVRSIVNHGDYYVQTAISRIGWNYVDAPMIIVILLCLALFVAALYAKKELVSFRKILILIALLSLLGIASIFGTLYIIFNPVGSNSVDGVQGRYFIPFIIPIILAVAYYVPFEIKISNKSMVYILLSITIVGLLFSAWYYYLATY